MKRFAWLALAILALALSAPSWANATLVPGEEVVVAFAAVGLPSELAPLTTEAPFVLSSAFEVDSAFNVRRPSSRVHMGHRVSHRSQMLSETLSRTLGAEIAENGPGASRSFWSLRWYWAGADNTKQRPRI